MPQGVYRLALLNPKGGCGKTTIATNLASYYAHRRYATVLMDHDTQGSSTRWLERRSHDIPSIYGVAAFRNSPGLTRSFQHRIPPETQRLVVDTQAGVRGLELRDLLRGTDVAIIPVLPSHIDMDAAQGFIKELLLVPQLRSGQLRVGIVVNRLRDQRTEFPALEEFLEALGLPVVARLRDSERYVSAGGSGRGIYELDPGQTAAERDDWSPLLRWIEGDASVIRIASERPAVSSTVPFPAALARGER